MSEWDFYKDDWSVKDPRESRSVLFDGTQKRGGCRWKYRLFGCFVCSGGAFRDWGIHPIIVLFYIHVRVVI